MRTSAELREGFLAFFEEQGHLRVPSASLLPRADDRTTLFTSAGMQPQMPYFLELEPPPAPLVTTVQKCFRTPDIDEVGLDTYHLTFFEMLGNFSFGQYFKEGAIELATEFIRDRLGLDWDRLWVSVHAGDPELGLGPDQEAIDLWQRIGMPAERIVPLPSSENFWHVGGPGPCGPDSEIYFDWGPETGCGAADCLPGCTRCERFLEFWNLVFMSYELHADGTLTPLPRQNIDTGLGLERTARIVQDVASVYDTDGYQLIMDWIASTSGVAYGESPDATKAHRVLADHARGMTFIVAEGVVPSNEGRGYVLRRVIRRAVQHGLRIGLEAPFLAGLSETVIEQMAGAYPELAAHRAGIHEVLTAEERRFGETLERGMKLFEEVVARGEITGDDAFKLHDTYGFPLELTRELATERGLTLDEQRFEQLMTEQRERSRRAGAFEVEVKVGGEARTEFVGYEKVEALTAIAGLEALEDGLFQAKLHESPFYPEGGGQVSDEGWIEKEDGTRAELVNAIRLGEDQALTFRGEGFAEGDRVRAVVPWSHRFPTMANHTATHLLHQALREELGEHVRQAGSAVRPDKLRFDFTHGQALTPEQREAVERRVNEKVFENLPVLAYVVPIENARTMGAMMLFGEKYGDDVRVIEVPGYSLELCGGTHVSRTAEIGPFVILGEGSVGSGVRRIEAVTSGEAYAHLSRRARAADELTEELARARRERPTVAAADTVDVDADVKAVGGFNVIAQRVDGLGADALLDLSDRFKQRNVPAAVVLGSVEDGRVHLVCNFDQAVADRVSASEVAKAAAGVVGGGGGGRPTMARAGGAEPEKLAEALAEAERLVLAALAP